MSVFEWGPGETAFENWEPSGAARSEAALETELAHELLSVGTEAELEEFLGKLVRSVGRFAKSGVGRAIGGVLRSVGRTVLPLAGSALGSIVPGVGTVIGGRLGSMAGTLLEAEEAEMLGELAELEAALRYVRWARAATRNAANAPPSAPAYLVARSAAVAAARRHAPTLLRPRRGGSPWRGRRAVRFGARPAWSGQRGWAPWTDDWSGTDPYAGAGYDPADEAP